VEERKKGKKEQRKKKEKISLYKEGYQAQHV